MTRYWRWISLAAMVAVIAVPASAQTKVDRESGMRQYEQDRAKREAERREQRRAERETRDTDEMAEPEAGDVLVTPDASAEPAELTDADIQKIRWALIPTTTKPTGLRASFRSDFRRRFTEEAVQSKKMKPEEVGEFNRMSVAEQLQIVKQLTGDKYRDEIIIRNDPPIIAGFRSDVLTLLQSSCARSGCHANNPQAPFELRLPARTNASIYANFLNLETFRAKAGWLIDRENPDRSLLLTYALPKDNVTTGFRHPVDIRPAFRSTEDSRYAKVLAWIKSLPKTPPNYGVSLPPSQAKRLPVRPAEDEAAPAAETPKEEKPQSGPETPKKSTDKPAGD